MFFDPLVDWLRVELGFPPKFLVYVFYHAWLYVSSYMLVMDWLLHVITDHFEITAELLKTIIEEFLLMYTE